MSRINDIHVRVVALDLDAARQYLRAIEQMTGEAARSTNLAVIVLALQLIERQAPQARALAKAA